MDENLSLRTKQGEISGEYEDKGASKVGRGAGGAKGNGEGKMRQGMARVVIKVTKAE